jgi:hypothetical protein
MNKNIPLRAGFVILILLIFMITGCNSKPSALSIDKTPPMIWGIDTASIVDEAFFQCVTDSYGQPAFIGRYLKTKEGVSYGITEKEVKFLHAENIKIVPIYNHFTNATTYDKGVEEARSAITYAESVGVPKGVYIFADIEPNYPVDSDFLKGWSETMLKSPYLPGIYGVFVERSDSNLLAAYKNFINKQKQMEETVAIWTSDVEEGITTKKRAPKQFAPEIEAFTEVEIWQYGIDGEVCNIDTNLMRSKMLNHLW